MWQVSENFLCLVTAASSFFLLHNKSSTTEAVSFSCEVVSNGVKQGCCVDDRGQTRLPGENPIADQ